MPGARAPHWQSCCSPFYRNDSLLQLHSPTADTHTNAALSMGLAQDNIRRERGGGGLWDQKKLCTENGPIRFFQWYISFFPMPVTRGGGLGGGGAPPTVVGRSNVGTREGVTFNAGAHIP